MITATIFTAMLNTGTVDYNTYQFGPHVVYEGTARLYADEDNKFPCLDYSFSIPEGEIRGSSISSNPGQPMLPFDSWSTENDELNISWCRTQLPLHPFTGEDMQTYPIQTPRNFKFFVTKTTFNAYDLANLLSDWGPPEVVDVPWPGSDYTQVSPWDLNGDTVVDGEDLVVIIENWETN